MKLTVVFAFACLAVLQTGFAQAEEKFRPLKGREITARFSGKELSDEIHYVKNFERGGVYRANFMGRKTTGAWRVEKNELCIAREKEERRCYEIWVSAKDVQLRQPGLDVFETGILRKPSK